jgi:DNA transposition AAA+ family ATPase
MVNTTLPPLNELVAAILIKVDALINVYGTNVFRISDGAGISRNAISQMRNGAEPSYKTLQKLSVWLDSRDAELAAKGAMISVQANTIVGAPASSEPRA